AGARGTRAPASRRRAARALRRRQGRRAHSRHPLFIHSSGMKVGIVGLGYVGLPLGVAFAEAGHNVVGVDSDARKVSAIQAGESYIEDVSSDRLGGLLDRLRASLRYADLASCDAVVIAVPTPLTRNREPDL